MRILRALGRLLRWLTPKRIRWKISAPYVGLTLLVAFIGTYFASTLLSGQLEDRFDNQLAESARVTADAVVRRERQHLTVLRSIAFTVGVPQSLRSRDDLSLRALVEPIAANARTDYVEVLDARGHRVLGLQLGDEQSLVYRPMVEPADRSDLPAVRNVLQRRTDDMGDKFAQIAPLRDGPALYTAGPVYDGQEVVGIILIGSRLDSVLPAIKREALADVTFYNLQRDMIASTFSIDNSPDADLKIESVGHSPATLAGTREARSFYGRGFELLYGELRVRDETVGFFSTALPSSFISSATAETRQVMMLIFAAATAAVMAVGLIVAQNVTAPLIALVRTAVAVTAGDLTVRSGVHSSDEIGVLASSFDTMTERLANQHLQTIRALSSAIDARDPYTAGHSIRVGQLSVEIGRQLELPRRDLQFLEIGGYLHDVGKIGIRDSILLKEGPLTPTERRLVEEHPRIGLSIIQYVELPNEVIEVVVGHHEKLDGTGYPYGLDSSAISVFARVAAVSDIYDALTTIRPYKPAMTVERAVEVILAEVEAGRLDARVVEALILALPTWGHRLSTEKDLRGLLLPELEDIARQSA